MKWLWLVVVACGACGGSSKIAADLAAPTDLFSANGSKDLQGGADAMDAMDAMDGMIADLLPAPGADLLPATGDCTLVLSNKVGSNVTATTLTFPYMFAAGKGLGCNTATAPTLCNFGATMSNVITFGSYQSFDTSLGAGTTVPFISAIAVSTDTAIFTYIEDPKRWHAQPGGSLTIDKIVGNSASLHFTVQLTPDTSPSGATGTFQIDGVCTDIDFRP